MWRSIRKEEVAITPKGISKCLAMSEIIFKRLLKSISGFLENNFNLASADQRMYKALEGYINILYGEKDIHAELKPDVEQEHRMDIFMCNSREVETSFGTTKEENIIVELKAPKVPLSKGILCQIEDYMNFVKKQPGFNSEFRQ